MEQDETSERPEAKGSDRPSLPSGCAYRVIAAVFLLSALCLVVNLLKGLAS